MSEEYAQNDPYLRRIEKEAYEKGNLIYRDWQDMKRKGKKEQTIQEAYNQRSMRIGQRLLKETIGTVAIPSAIPAVGLDQEIVQDVEDKLLQSNDSKDDIVMFIMLHYHVSKQEAEMYYRKSIQNLNSDQLADLDENQEHEYEIGDKEELEHTDVPQKAHKIAQDHVEGRAEHKGNPKYYTKLKKCGLTDDEE